MDKATALEIIAQLSQTDVARAYSGKPGCACGCNGTYVDNKDNPKQVRNVIRKLQRAAGELEYFEDLNQAGELHVNAAPDLQYITAQISPRRVYTVYLTSEKRRACGITEGYDL
jgi:hypothetical protein